MGIKTGIGKWAVWTAIAAGLAANVAAADLFVDKQLRQMPQFAKLSPDDTQGGYGLYPGEGKWIFLTGNTSGTSGVEIRLGTTSWLQLDGLRGDIVQAALMSVTTNLGQGGYGYWGGDPCGAQALVKINKPRGMEDHCVTVHAEHRKVGKVDTTFMVWRITHTAGQGRYYQMVFAANLNLLGHLDTEPGDWLPSLVATHPERKAILERASQWGEALLNASGLAFGYDKPLDAYQSLPSWRALMPIPETLAHKKYSQSFISALVDLEHRGGLKAMAYAKAADGRMRWSRHWGSTSQAEADKKALEGCETNKAADLPACVLYAPAQ